MWCFIYKAFDCLRQHDLLLAKLYAYVFDYKSLNFLMHNVPKWSDRFGTLCIEGLNSFRVF